MRIAIVTPDPREWMHVRAFDEVAEAVAYGFALLGHEVWRAHNLDPEAKANILFGSHHVRPEVVLPPATILFNLEQIIPGTIWLGDGYVARLRGHRVWDYSVRNVQALREKDVNARYVPVGHVPSLERIAPQAEDIDVLFYGRNVERRVALLDRLAARGVRVHRTNALYGAERDALSARAKIILNVHAYEDARLEVARCFYLMINGRFVLSEDSVDSGESGLAEGLALARYEDLEERCLWFLAHPEERAAIAEKGRAIMRARPQAERLRPLAAELAG